MENNRTTKDIIKEKYEDRGWTQDTYANKVQREEIKPLPLSFEEYKSFSLILAKLALQDRDPKLCETYFDLQRRALFGNRYPIIEKLAEIEQELWTIGTGQIIESNTHRR